MVNQPLHPRCNCFGLQYEEERLGALGCLMKHNPDSSIKDNDGHDTAYHVSNR